MKLRKIKEATQLISEQELAKVVKTVEDRLIHAAEDKESIYHVTETKEKDGKWIKYHYGNYPWIMQDMIVTNTAMAVVNQLGLPEYKPKGKYHFHGGTRNSLFNSTNMRRRQPLSTPIDVEKLASKVIPALTAKIKKDKPHDNVKIATQEGSYRGFSIDEVIWHEVVFPMESVIHEYIRQAHIQFEDSEYFPKEMPVIDNEFQFGPDTFVGRADMLTKPWIGIEEQMTRKPREKKYDYSREELVLTDKGKEIMAGLSEEVIEKVNAELKKALEGQTSKYHKDYGSTHYFNWKEIVREYTPHEFGRTIESWINGLYFKSEGIYHTPQSRVLVTPYDDMHKIDWIPEETVLELAQEIWKTGISYVERMKGYAGIEIFMGCSGCTPFITHTGKLSPKATINFGTAAGFIDDVMIQHVEQSFDFPRCDFYGQEKEKGVPYMDRDSINWRT